MTFLVWLGHIKKVNDITELINNVAEQTNLLALNAAIEAGQSVPDIISADTTKVLNYYPNIPCNDVTDLVNKINEERPYLQASYDGTKIDDKYYYVPFYSSSTLMFIRKDKFEEADIINLYDKISLAEELEVWFDEYSKVWRKRNKESELNRIREVIKYSTAYLRSI